MIISRARTASAKEIESLGWNGIRRFKNVDFTSKYLCELHQLPINQRQNTKKQADNIRQCIIQAEDYFIAAKHVGLATKPLLYYYGVMSLALAEVLLKQDGNSSLQRAREKNSYHGLIFKFDQQDFSDDKLEIAAGALKAVPLIMQNGERSGTFDLWHRSSREGPIIGKVTTILQNGGQTVSDEIIALPKDARPELIKNSGISLLECFRYVSRLRSPLAAMGIKSGLVRGIQTLNRDNPNKRITIITAIHPGENDIINTALEKFRFPASVVPELIIKEMPSGIIYTSHHSSEYSGDFGSMPSCFQEDVGEILFCSDNESLNEFGVIYAACFMLGNLARYYPDFWVKDVERSSDLALIVEILLEVVAERAPLLTNAELTRTAFALR